MRHQQIVGAQEVITYQFKETEVLKALGIQENDLDWNVHFTANSDNEFGNEITVELSRAYSKELYHPKIDKILNLATQIREASTEIEMQMLIDCVIDQLEELK